MLLSGTASPVHADAPPAECDALTVGDALTTVGTLLADVYLNFTGTGGKWFDDARFMRDVTYRAAACKIFGPFGPASEDPDRSRPAEALSGVQSNDQ